MTWHERNKPFSGKSIAQIAQQQGQGIMDTFLTLLWRMSCGRPSRSSTAIRTWKPSANSRLTLHGHRHYRWRRAAG